MLLCEDAPHGFDLPDSLFLPLVSSTGRRKAGASELDGEPSQFIEGEVEAARIAERGMVWEVQALVLFERLSLVHLQFAVGENLDVHLQAEADAQHAGAVAASLGIEALGGGLQINGWMVLGAFGIEKEAEVVV